MAKIALILCIYFTPSTRYNIVHSVLVLNIRFQAEKNGASESNGSLRNSANSPTPNSEVGATAAHNSKQDPTWVHDIFQGN